MNTASPDLSVADVQAASSRGGLQQLLARLGYDSRTPVEQTAVGLGFAERVQPLVLQAWRLVQRNGLGLPLEVYWFEVKTLTVDLRKALATAFRNKPVNALLVLTTRDHNPLDFVLVEKALGATTGPGGQVTVSYRLFSVDRLRPSPMHLRVLGRMSNTAADPYSQYERIRDAFRLAEWSTDEFNNRNLFSDYFLRERLTNREFFPVWDTNVLPAQRELNGILRAAGEPRQLDAAAYRSRFIEPLLGALGFRFTVPPRGEAEADYLLRPADSEPDAAPRAALLVYPWDRPLDRQDEPGRERADDVPGIRVIRALEHHKVPWAVLTNGKDWRLYCAQAHSRATNYYEVDLPDSLERDDPKAFRYFYLFFRTAAFVPQPVPEAPGEPPVSFLDQVRIGSEAFAKEVGDRLRKRIFEEVFPYLAQGFVAFRKEERGEGTAAGDPFLDDVYDATLTLLYRLLFLLYAEALGLVPVGQPAYDALSLNRLKQQVKEAAGEDEDAVEERLKKRYSRTEAGLYVELAKLFAAIDQGSKECLLPAYNGGLFRTRPADDDASREARAARFLADYCVPDFYLAYALDLLARGEDPRSHALVFVDYKALGVRQLGSIYEGLLMYHVVVPRGDDERAHRRPGLKVALVPSNTERKSTGSYFTP